MKWLYMYVNLGTILVPFLYSFHPRIRFYKAFGHFLLSASISATFFVIWDAIFTAHGVWHFNPDYVLGIYIGNLPLEEVLFFYCIPFSCQFTYFCLEKFWPVNWSRKAENWFALVFTAVLLGISIIYRQQAYTCITFSVTALIFLVLKFIAKVDWLHKAATYYSVLLLPFFIVNGILTGTGPDAPVVIYNDAENMGIRLLTIPIEDVIYGFEMFLLNIYFFKLVSGRSRKVALSV